MIAVSGAKLFSAYAEVFLSDESSQYSPIAFLCLRRGVSQAQSSVSDLEGFSLPTQRCFRRGCSGSTRNCLFSAYAEVFP